MIASNFTKVRDNFKSFCDKASDGGEIIIIICKNDKNIILMSEVEYNNMVKKIQEINT